MRWEERRTDEAGLQEARIRQKLMSWDEAGGKEAEIRQEEMRRNKSEGNEV